MIGTPAYMAPEQIHGAATDPRTDLFALGLVLHEMLAGQHPFRRERTADTMAAILRDDAPDLAADVPAPLLQIVARCLARAADDRFQSAKDLAFALSTLADAAPGLPGTSPASGVARRASAALAGAAAVAAAAAVALWPSTAAPPVPLALEVVLAADHFVASGTGPALALSPDARILVYAAAANDRVGLYRRTLDSFRSEFLAAGATPFFSTDGRRVGFFTPVGLFQVPSDGGPPSLVCKTGSTARGGTWIDDHRLVFNPVARSGLRLSTGPAATMSR